MQSPSHPAPAASEGQVMREELTGNIGARYRIVSCLGQGGMGVVYEVEDENIGRRRALKTLLPELGEQRDMRERFQRAINILAQSVALARPGLGLELRTTGAAGAARELSAEDFLETAPRNDPLCPDVEEIGCGMEDLPPCGRRERSES